MTPKMLVVKKKGKKEMPKSEHQSRWKSPRHYACTDPVRVSVGKAGC